MSSLRNVIPLIPCCNPLLPLHHPLHLCLTDLILPKAWVQGTALILLTLVYLVIRHHHLPPSTTPDPQTPHHPHRVPDNKEITFHLLELLSSLQQLPVVRNQLPDPLLLLVAG